MYTAQCWGNSLAVDGGDQKTFFEAQELLWKEEKDTCRYVLGLIAVPCL